MAKEFDLIDMDAIIGRVNEIYQRHKTRNCPADHQYLEYFLPVCKACCQLFADCNQKFSDEFDEQNRDKFLKIQEFAFKLVESLKKLVECYGARNVGEDIPFREFKSLEVQVTKFNNLLKKALLVQTKSQLGEIKKSNQTQAVDVETQANQLKTQAVDVETQSNQLKTKPPVDGLVKSVNDGDMVEQMFVAMQSLSQSMEKIETRLERLEHILFSNSPN